MPGEGGGHDFPPHGGRPSSGCAAERPLCAPESLETLIGAYWKPVYKYVRVKWGRPREEAEDLTQGFFLRAMEKGFFEDYDSEKSRFRTFLRTCVDAYVANEHRAGERQKRGGEAVRISMDFHGAEGELEEIPSAPSESPPEAFFQAEWVRGLFSLALESLKRECEAQGKALHFRLFERYDLDNPAGDRRTYEALAAEFGIPVTAVTNHPGFRPPGVPPDPPEEAPGDHRQR